MSRELMFGTSFAPKSPQTPKLAVPKRGMSTTAGRLERRGFTMRSFNAILPGARVRTDEGFLGTVERLDRHWAESGDQPDRMIVRSEDERWRYSIPLMFVHSVTQGTFQPIVYIALRSDELIHYIYEPILRQTRPSVRAVAPTDTAVQPDDNTLLKVPLHNEELFVRKRPVVLGRIHVHKDVVSEERHVSLPVYHEETIIDHLSPDQFDPAQAREHPNDVYIPIIEERLVVQKQLVVREYLRIRKQRVTEQQEVNDTVRHETVRISEERQPNTPPHVRLIRSAPPDIFEADVADQPTITSECADELQVSGPVTPQE